MRFLVVLSLVLAMLGCATTHDRLFDTDTSQVQLRSIQTRAFDTTDKIKTLRAAIATLQDLGFVIDKADAAIGIVSATKAQVGAYPAAQGLKVTVTVRPRGETQVMVRASAELSLKPVTDPKPYQQFFVALEKSMFLQAHEVD